MPEKLDPLDRRILAALLADGRISFVDLAARVGLSATPCLRRVRRLEKDGVVRGYAARLDPRAVGLGLQAFVFVGLESHAEDVVAAFQDALLARPEVVAAYLLGGEIDYMLHVMVPDLEAFNAFALKALLRMPGVRTTRSSFVMSELKPFALPLPPP
jgi:Lrp/AsnC family leucine-responsive transcriptional regulator